MFMSTTHVTSMSPMTIEEKPLEIGRLTGSCQAYRGVISTPATPHAAASQRLPRLSCWQTSIFFSASEHIVR